MPSVVSTRASAALRPDPAPTISAVLNFTVGIASLPVLLKQAVETPLPGRRSGRHNNAKVRGCTMRAAYYEKNGAARDVLTGGAVDAPTPGRGEVRVKLRTAGVNPSDVKAREGRTRKLSYPRVIPHSDGAGDIDMVCAGVPA